MRVTRVTPTTARLRTLKQLAVPRDPRTVCPVRWEQDIGRLLYWFELDYNALGQFFTLAIGIGPEEAVRTKLVYGVDIMGPFQYLDAIDGLMIVPVDFGFVQAEAGVTRANLGDSVRLLYHYEVPA